MKLILWKGYVFIYLTFKEKIMSTGNIGKLHLLYEMQNKLFGIFLPTFEIKSWGSGIPTLKKKNIYCYPS